MNIRTRRVIMFSFILAFFILAPVIIFYASGYRVDLKRGKLIKTGTVFLEGKDISNAKFYINNELYEKPFDQKLFVYNLIPGEYDLKIEKDNYYPWEKKVNVYSGITTFSKDIILFKKNVPLQLIDGNITNFYLSPDFQKIIYAIKKQETTELHLLNLDTKEINALYTLPSGINAFELSWAASSKRILLSFNNNHFVLNTDNLDKKEELNKIIKFKPEILKWDIENDTIIYGVTENNIYKIDLVSQTADKIFTAKNPQINQEFFIEGNDIFYIEIQDNQDVLYKYNLSFQTNKKILGLRKATSYKFITSKNNYLSLIDLNNQKLYLIQKVAPGDNIDLSANLPVKEFNAKNADWDKNEKQLVIYSDFEIYTYNVENSSETLVNRYGQQIDKVTWYPNLPYLLILLGDSLKILDLNVDNGSRNITELTKFENINDFEMDKKGEKIYFDGSIGKQSGLYQLNIK